MQVTEVEGAGWAGCSIQMSLLSAASACVIFQEWLTSIHMLVGTYTRMLAPRAIASVCTQAIATSYAPHHLLCIVTLHMLYI